MRYYNSNICQAGGVEGGHVGTFKSVFLPGTSLIISHLTARAGSLRSQCLLTALEPVSEARQFLCI